MYSILNHKVSLDVKLDRDVALGYIKDSGLLGRGGAAFPVYKKWESFIATETEKKYVVVNAHEGELNCAKDAYLIEHNVQAVLDGALIAADLTHATEVIICAKESDQHLIDIINKAKPENIKLFITCDDYIAGEETALIEEIENGLPYPRPKPPYPTVAGISGYPTLMHNAETMAHISYIARNGIEEFKSTGTEYSRGTKLFTISGDVQKPGVYEAEFGISLRRLIDDQAGCIVGNIYAILPGFSRVIKTCNSLSLDYESFFAVGSHLGTGNIRVFNSPASLKAYIIEVIKFIAQASCGQCSTCRNICKIALKIVQQGRVADIDELSYYMNGVKGMSRCALMPSMLDMLQNYLEATE